MATKFQFGLTDWKSEATDNAISPDSLFKMSYTLRETASWMTEYQSEQADPQTWISGARPGMSDVTPERTFAMQTVAVDSVTACGPRQFGWADTRSAVATLDYWLCMVDTSIARAIAGECEMELDRRRIRQFANTILGGMCRRGGSYQKADDSAFCPLEDWLCQRLMISTGKF